jgi:hypothetical protein
MRKEGNEGKNTASPRKVWEVVEAEPGRVEKLIFGG